MDRAGDGEDDEADARGLTSGRHPARGSTESPESTTRRGDAPTEVGDSAESEAVRSPWACIRS